MEGGCCTVQYDKEYFCAYKGAPGLPQENLWKGGAAQYSTIKNTSVLIKVDRAYPRRTCGRGAQGGWCGTAAGAAGWRRSGASAGTLQGTTHEGANCTATVLYCTLDGDLGD